MPSILRFVIAFWLLMASFIITAAQEAKTLNYQPSTQTVTAFVLSDGVRFAAFGAATEIRLEVYASIGERVFDSGFRNGTLLDWNPAQGSSSLPDGAYLCVVTYRDLQSRLRQKLGGLAVKAGRAALQKVSQQPLTPELAAALTTSRKAQSIEAAEDDEALTILPESAERARRFPEPGNVTPSAIGTGTLNFIAKWKETGGKGLLGDSGLFEATDGNIGIGTPSPSHLLDVAGNINTSTHYFIRNARVLSAPGRSNLFAGENAGLRDGGENTLIGAFAGRPTANGSRNTLIGAFAQVGTNNLTNATAIGFSARVDTSNSMVLGSINGVNGATADTNVGIGTTKPTARLHITGNTSDPATPLALLQSTGRYIPLSFASTGDSVRERARITAENSGELTIATTDGISRRIHFDAGNDDDVSNANYDARFADLIIVPDANRGRAGKVGIGTSHPTNRLTIGSPEDTVTNNPRVGIYNAGSAYATVRDTTNDVEGLFGAEADHVIFGSTTSDDIQFRTGNVTRMTIDTNGNATIGSDTGGIYSLHVFGVIRTGLSLGNRDVPLCAGSENTWERSAPTYRISRCPPLSSIRYKKDVRDLTLGLDFVSRLRPVDFRWKDSSREDVGLIAEEVERVEPLFVTRDDKGEVEGVRYDRLGVVLIKAVQEQQAHIKAQQQQLQAKDARITDLETRLASLERVVNERINPQPRRTKVSRARQPTTARR